MASRLGYLLDGVFTPLKETEKAFYYYQSQYYSVTAENLAQWEGYTDCLGVIYINEAYSRNLSPGQTFVLAPKKKQGYFLNSTFIELTPAQTVSYYYNGEYFQASPEFYGQWAQVKDSLYTAISEEGETKWLPQGTLVQYFEPQSPVAPVKHNVPKFKKCSVCTSDSVDFYTLLGNAVCISCLKKKYLADELFSSTRDKVHWSSEMVYDVYMALKNRLPSEEQHQLGNEIKLPLESFVCCGENRPDAPGYPPEGHICGNSSKLPAESGCSDHPLCKRCANRLDFCPKDGNAIAYEEDLPVPCPNGCSSCITKEFPCKVCRARIPYRKAINANK